MNRHGNPKVPEDKRCPRCLGWGFIIRQHNDEKIDEDCHKCEGTGRRGKG